MNSMKKRGGFTLIEMIIVIAIMAILATVFLSYDKSGERQVILLGEQTKVVALLNRAKALALGGAVRTIDEVKTGADSKVTVAISGNSITITDANGVPSQGQITLEKVTVSGGPIVFYGPSLRSDGGEITLTYGSITATIDVTSAGAITYK